MRITTRDVFAKLSEITNPGFYISLDLPEYIREYWKGYRAALCTLLQVSTKDYPLPFEKK